jgi:DNA-directed RNA polymerase subunit M
LSQISFCKKCGTKMALRKEGPQLVFICNKCGYSETVKRLTKPLDKKRPRSVIKVIGKEGADLKPLPIAEVVCPKCGHGKAYFWLVQTRGADESATQFFRCEKCNYTWREYS